MSGNLRAPPQSKDKGLTPYPGSQGLTLPPISRSSAGASPHAATASRPASIVKPMAMASASLVKPKVAASPTIVFTTKDAISPSTLKQLPESIDYEQVLSLFHHRHTFDAYPRLASAIRKIARVRSGGYLVSDLEPVQAVMQQVMLTVDQAVEVAHANPESEEANTNAIEARTHLLPALVELIRVHGYPLAPSPSSSSTSPTSSSSSSSLAQRISHTNRDLVGRSLDLCIGTLGYKDADITFTVVEMLKSFIEVHAYPQLVAGAGVGGGTSRQPSSSSSSGARAPPLNETARAALAYSFIPSVAAGDLSSQSSVSADGTPSPAQMAARTAALRNAALGATATAAAMLSTSTNKHATAGAGAGKTGSLSSALLVSSSTLALSSRAGAAAPYSTLPTGCAMALERDAATHMLRAVRDFAGSGANSKALADTVLVLCRDLAVNTICAKVR